MALPDNDSLKHKMLANNQAGFVELAAWLQKRGIARVYVCLEASITRGASEYTLPGERYNIVSEEDLRAASQRLSCAHAAMQEATAQAQSGTITGTIPFRKQG